MRLFILMLSMGCVILYGYALAGYAGYWFGNGRPDYVIGGLGFGTLCGGLALYLWKKNMHRFFVEITETEEETNDDAADKN